MHDERERERGEEKKERINTAIFCTLCKIEVDISTCTWMLHYAIIHVQWQPSSQALV